MGAYPRAWFFAWLGISLAGVATNAASYAACRDSEMPGGGPIG
jgi:hypothetical protein